MRRAAGVGTEILAHFFSIVDRPGALRRAHAIATAAEEGVHRAWRLEVRKSKQAEHGGQWVDVDDSTFRALLLVEAANLIEQDSALLSELQPSEPLAQARDNIEASVADRRRTTLLPYCDEVAGVETLSSSEHSQSTSERSPKCEVPHGGGPGFVSQLP